MSSSFAPHFPQELVDHIIDHLYDDHPTLRSCSRVCRAWLPTSRFHLFAKISLKAASAHGGASFPQARCKRLHWALDNSPEISSYIRELEICEGSPYHNHHPEIHSTTWITTEPTLLALFKRLKSLKRLDFSTTSILYWKMLPSTFQNALCSLLATSPSLTYIRLHSWCFPNVTSLAVFLSHCKNLKGLSLSSTNVGDDDDNGFDERLGCVIEEVEESCDDDDTVQSARLEVLTLDFVSFTFLGYWLMGESSSVDVSCLRELRVAHFPDVSVIEKLLLAVGGSLEHLHLKPGCWNVHPFDLTHNHNLRSLRMTVEEPDTAMDWVVTLLSHVKSSTVLERIGIEFYVDVKKLDGWGNLDTLLVQPELGSLRQVEVGLFASPSHPEFIKVDKELVGLRSRVDLRLYQLGIKSQRSNRQLTPRISGYEAS